MNFCESHKAISKEVRDFMLNVSDVKEESITDYLVWKWRELDKRFNFIKVTPFTRHEENTKTGADFEIELELWIVGNDFNFPLLFQAKKVVKDFHSYVTKFNYKNGTQDQLTKLIEYAKLKRRLPFYMLYNGGIDNNKIRAMCIRNDVKESALFIADAFTIKEVADGKYGNQISRYDLIAKSNPFHCIFCCPLSNKQDYFRYYFPKLYTEIGYDIPKQTSLPNYVSYLLFDKADGTLDEKMTSLIKENEISHIRVIGVYNMREPEIETKDSISQ